MTETYKRVFNPEKGKWESIRVYTEEDLRRAFKNGFSISYGINDIDSIDKKEELFKEWFNQYKK
jgi:hypothetical protein